MVKEEAVCIVFVHEHAQASEEVTARAEEAKDKSFVTDFSESTMVMR